MPRCWSGRTPPKFGGRTPAATVLGKGWLAAELRPTVDRAASLALQHKALRDTLYQGEDIDKLNNIVAVRRASSPTGCSS